MKKVICILMTGALLCAMLSVPIAAAGSVPFDKMIALYNMTGSTLKDDVSGKDGVLYNGAKLVVEDGRNSLYLNNEANESVGQLDGGYLKNGQWAELAAPYIPDSDEMTVSLWVKMKELRTWARAIELADRKAQNELEAAGNNALDLSGAASPDRFINISPSNGSNFVGTINGNDMGLVPNNRDRSFGDQPDTDKWIHAVYVINKGKPNVLYVDGTAYLSTNGNAGDDPEDATFSPKDILASEHGLRNGYLGRSGYENNGDQIFYGFISDVAIFSVALTAEQVAELGKTDFSKGNPAKATAAPEAPAEVTAPDAPAAEAAPAAPASPKTGDCSILLVALIGIASASGVAYFGAKRRTSSI